MGRGGYTEVGLDLSGGHPILSSGKEGLRENEEWFPVSRDERVA